MENNKDFQNKKRLGRGIGSLLGGAEFSTNEKATANQSQKMNTQPTSTQQKNSPVGENTVVTAAESRIWNISIDKLVPGIYQPRKTFNKESIEELSISIKENGIIQPLVARKRTAGGYEIIAGERRWRAAQVAGLHEVPVILKDISDPEALQLAIIENVQREDLDPIEEAEAYQRLMQEFSLSQQQVAEKVGKERSTIANALRLIALPNELKEMVSKKILSVGHAKVLMALPSKQAQIKLAKAAIEKQMSVRALESLIKSQQFDAENLDKADATAADPLKTDLSQRLAKELSDQLQKSLGTKVQINYRSGKGDLTIHFYSDEQLNAIYEKINR